MNTDRYKSIDDYKNIDILKRAEMKRVSENLTKKELCSVFDINYQFYLNTIGGTASLSIPMGEGLLRYLQTETSKVYEMVFAYRGTDKALTPKKSLKMIKINGQWKEPFHEKLQISAEEFKSYTEHLKKNDILKEPCL